MSTSALLGFEKENTETTKEEGDLMERSLKKIKGGEKPFEPGSSLPVSYADIGDQLKPKSYKESMMGRLDLDDEGDFFSDAGSDMEGRQEEEKDFSGMEVVEKSVGGHACPVFVLTKEEEVRLQKPWRNGVIVKLLGRKIGFKALETRLKQMWIRNGIINIVDVGNDFFLVTFTSKEDHYRALIDGPWMIYDNYLVVREWSPNFHPMGEVIEKVAVWVRFSGLPIEYYDNKMLHFIGNRIGRTVKVDRTTQAQARGKYARLCVEVDLTKPLLAMFQIKDRLYKVEYEGLHMLCLTCGTFGHYKEGCVAKNNNVAWNGEHTVETSGKGGVSGVPAQEGPWTVVQKARRPRKKGDGGRPETAPAVEGPGSTGSRFAILREDIPRLEETLNDQNNAHNDVSMISADNVNPHHKAKHQEASKRKISERNNTTGDYRVRNLSQEKNKESNGGPTPKARDENLVVVNSKGIKNKGTTKEFEVDYYMEEGQSRAITMGEHKDSTKECYILNNKNEEPNIRGINMAQPHSDPKHFIRPPDQHSSILQPIITLEHTNNGGGGTRHRENATLRSSDDIMEVVEETPVLEQGQEDEVGRQQMEVSQ
jgi:hypothetical protein